MPIIRGIKDSYTLILCKMNGQRMGKIPYAIIDNIHRGIKTVSELTFTVNKYCGKDNEINPLYDELKSERFIYLDEDECYVIKNIKEKNETSKTVTAYSREKKLYKITAEFEDISITLRTPYTDIEGCFSLDELLYDATGWHLGYISDSVLYKSNETVLDIITGETEITLTTDEKLRYQESVSTNWYDYINNDIAEQFECFPVFNSYDKTIDLYSDEELGNDPNLMLTYDNYLKDIEREDDTDEIVTVLNLSGNDDLTISEINPSGDTYIEDYSYFIKSGEMSNSLISALNTYYEMVKQRAITWNELKERKVEVMSEMTDKKNELLLVYSTIKSIEFTIEQSSDEAYIAKQTERIYGSGGYNDQRAILEKRIDELEIELNGENRDGTGGLNGAIANINKLCKKKYATNNNGILIFNETLLNELKDFIYQDSYSNDSITDNLTLMKVGKRQLERNCMPKKSWSIDSVNFIERLIDNGFRQHWNGELGLGDMIVLKGNESIEVIYLVGYSQNFKDKAIQLELANVKEENSFSLAIGEKLTQGKEAYRIAMRSRSTINRVNKNRVGLTYDKVNKKIL